MSLEKNNFYTQHFCFMEIAESHIRLCMIFTLRLSQADCDGVSAIRMAVTGIKGGSCGRRQISSEATRRRREKYAEADRERAARSPSLWVSSQGDCRILKYFLATLFSLLPDLHLDLCLLLFPSRVGFLVAFSSLAMRSTSNRKLRLSSLPISHDVSWPLIILEQSLTFCRRDYW